MTETFVRVSDVADEIVQSYLHRLTHRIDSDLIKEAWFRVVPGGLVSLPVEPGATVAMRPVFEVLVSVSGTAEGLSGALAEAATDVSGNVRLMADAVLDGQMTPDDLELEGWRSTNVPRLRMVVGQQEALAL